jgi:hypothetical protein
MKGSSLLLDWLFAIRCLEFSDYFDDFVFVGRFDMVSAGFCCSGLMRGWETKQFCFYLYWLWNSSPCTASHLFSTLDKTHSMSKYSSF